MSPRLSLDKALGADERSLAFDMLMANHLSRFIPSGRQWQWADEALAAGRLLAGKTRLAQGDLDVRQLAARSGVSVKEEASGRALGPLMFVATYELRPPTVTLHRAPLALLRGEVESRGLAEDFPELDAIAVAHELFHHLDQAQAGGSIGKAFRVTTARLGPWERTAVFHSGIEIAAHSFASALLNLRRFAGVLDYLMIYR
jgi:hypothetical protein